MKLLLYDPPPVRNDYLSTMYFGPMQEFAARVLKRPVERIGAFDEARNSVVLCHSDHLPPGAIATLKSNGCKIAGFSINDSCWITDSCRAGKWLGLIDLMFIVAGMQKVNTGREVTMDENFNIVLEERKFLPDEDWQVFNSMRVSGRLQSLPYVHWERQPEVAPVPFRHRSQKVLIRGGHHMRRYLLALRLIEHGLLDINSGFVTSYYFQDSMNPDFRFCDECRREFKRHGRAPYVPRRTADACRSPAGSGEAWDVSNLGLWNNRCPRSFYWMAEKFIKRCPPEVETLMNAAWLSQREHLGLLSRIAFTADFKWIFSIYAAQRVWDAASVGCVNFLPERTIDHEFFPAMLPGVHYIPFGEDLNSLPTDIQISESHFNAISGAMGATYDQWLKATDFGISTNLLRHIFEKIETLQ